MEAMVRPEVAKILYEDATSYGCPSVSYGGWRCVAMERITTLRWHELWRMVLVSDSDPDTYWGLEVREPLTENQDGIYPWDSWSGEAPKPLGLYPLWQVKETKVIVRYERRE